MHTHTPQFYSKFSSLCSTSSILSHLSLSLFKLSLTKNTPLCSFLQLNEELSSPSSSIATTIVKLSITQILNLIRVFSQQGIPQAPQFSSIVKPSLSHTQEQYSLLFSLPQPSSSSSLSIFQIRFLCSRFSLKDSLFIKLFSLILGFTSKTLIGSFPQTSFTKLVHFSRILIY